MSTDKLPHGWTRVKFGDVVRNVNENSRDLASDGLDRVVGLDHLDPGSLRLMRWDNLADLPDGTTFTRKFKPGQVLFGKRRAYQRKVAVADFAGVCSGDILVFEPADKRMLAEFLPYLVQSDGFFDHALGTSAGSLSPRTKWAELAKYEFALPPLKEQRELSALLNATDRAVDGVRQAMAAIEVLARSLRAQLAGHERVRLDSLASVIDCEHKKAPISSGVAYLVGTPDLKDGELILDASRTVSEATFLEWTRRGVPVGGDVLLARQAPIGEVALVPVSPSLCLGQQMVLIKPAGGADAGKLLYHYLRSDVAKVEIAQRSGGSAHPHLNMKDIRALLVPAPSSATAGLVEKLDACRETQGAMRRVLDRLGLSRSAFLGRLLDVQ